MADKYRILVDAQVNPVTQADIDKAIAKNAPKLKVQIQIDTSSLDNQLKNVSSKISKMGSAAVSKGTIGAGSSAIGYSAADSAKFFQDTFKDIKKFGTESSTIVEKFANVNDVIGKTGKTIKDTSGKWKTSDLLDAKSVDAMDVSWGKVGKTIGKDIVKFGEWIIAGTLVMQTLNQFKQMISYIVKLDTAMTNIKIITGKTDAEVNSLVGSYSKLAKEIGATTLQVADGAEQWLRAGKTADEAMELTRQSITLSKLGVMTAAEATKDLIAVLNGYKLAASEASSVVDKLIAVDNAAATSANDLATSLQYVAAVANQANVPLNKVIGLVATVSDVTQQSAESIGIAWKTIFTRISNVKVGKFIDLETGDKINDVEKVLTKLDIAVRKDRDTWRDTGDIIDDVAAKWSSFTDLEKNAISTSMAGKQGVCPNL